MERKGSDQQSEHQVEEEEEVQLHDQRQLEKNTINKDNDYQQRDKTASPSKLPPSRFSDRLSPQPFNSDEQEEVEKDDVCHDQRPHIFGPSPTIAQHDMHDPFVPTPSRPGAVVVRLGRSVADADDQSVDVRSTFSNVDQVMRAMPPLEPYPAYAVTEEKDGDCERGDGNQDDIKALRNELQQIGEAVNDIYGSLSSVVQAEIAEGSAQPQQQQQQRQPRPDDGHRGVNHRLAKFGLVGVVAVILCAGVAVIILVIYRDSKTAPNEKEERGYECFANRDELLQAIDSFLQGDDIGPKSTLAQRYGWPMNAWCTRRVSNFSSLFSSRRNPLVHNFNEDISSWDMSNARDMEALFAGAEAFNAHDLTSWNVSKVDNMRFLFDDAVSFNGNISTWDVSNVINMRAMFRNTRFAGDISTWDVSRSTDFSRMFSDSTFNGSISVWDVSSATVMNSMFQRAGSFDQDLSSWNVRRVMDMHNMFDEAISFDGDISTWDVSNVGNMLGMFRRSGFVGDISAWDVSKVENFEALFSHSDFDGDISSWDVSRATTMTEMFERASKFNQDLSSWDVSRVTSTARMFLQASMFNSDLSSWQVSKLINARMMFNGAIAFEGDDLPGWDVSQVIDTHGMFLLAESFNGNISTWNVSNVGDMQWMFQFALIFNQDLSSWDVARVNSFYEQFLGASSFRQNLCEWSVHVNADADIERMFIETSCDSEDDPILEGEEELKSYRGPFCFVCE